MQQSDVGDKPVKKFYGFRQPNAFDVKDLFKIKCRPNETASLHRHNTHNNRSL